MQFNDNLILNNIDLYTCRFLLGIAIGLLLGKHAFPESLSRSLCLIRRPALDLPKTRALKQEPEIETPLHGLVYIGTMLCTCVEIITSWSSR